MEEGIGSSPGPSNATPTRVLDETALPGESPDAAEAAVPERIGPYRVIGQLGEGGMGVILQAWQEEPVRRVVAIKLIKLGMDTKSVIARFRQEQQALALMNHPHVARVFEAGATATGRPYFVMEYVPGEPIANYCTAFRLDIASRLQLFQQACEAVQHAHQKGIVHRDLKSSNILVMLQDDKPSVKVIDFGVARATNAEKLFTEVGQFVGTPGYMSPEQACQGSMDVDTRSDIYSLGVVLYELLTGVHPIDPSTFRDAGYAEICKRIREVDPPPPSRRVALDRTGTVATETYSDLDRRDLVRRLRGDLDCIVMKAMEKDPRRRYASASGLAADVGRYLRSEPVTAGRPGVAYRFRRFVRRHPTGMAITAGVAVLLVVTAGVMTVAALRAVAAERALEAAHAKVVAEKQEAERQRAAAEEARATLEQVNRFLSDMLTAVRPNRVGSEATVHEVLDEASRRIAGQFKDQPLVEASLRHSIGRAYSSLQLPSQAVAHLREGLTIRQRLLGPNDPDTLWIENNLCNVVLRLGRNAEAEEMLRTVLHRRRTALSPRHAETLTTTSQLAALYEQSKQWDKAEPLLAELVEAHASSRATERTALAYHSARHGLCLTSLKRHAQAEAVLKRSLALMEPAGVQDQERAEQILIALADCCRALGRPQDAAVWESHRATLAAGWQTTQPATPSRTDQPAQGRSVSKGIRNRAPRFDLPVLTIPR